jgi:DNA-binding XRE family transcriptional regulator
MPRDERKRMMKLYRTLRESVGSLTEVAELLGVDRQTLHRREVGQAKITPEAMMAMKALTRRR